MYELVPRACQRSLEHDHGTTSFASGCRYAGREAAASPDPTDPDPMPKSSEEILRAEGGSEATPRAADVSALEAKMRELEAQLAGTQPSFLRLRASIVACYSADCAHCGMLGWVLASLRVSATLHHAAGFRHH